MKLDTPFIKLENNIDSNLQKNLLDIIISSRLWHCARGYCFDLTHGYSSLKLEDENSEFKNLMLEVEKIVSSNNLIKDWRLIDKGIGLVKKDKTLIINKAINGRLMDKIGHQVRIRLRGAELINSVSLENSSIYVIDNISGHKIEFDSTVDLVLTYIPPTENKKVWSYWTI